MGSCRLYFCWIVRVCCYWTSCQVHGLFPVLVANLVASIKDAALESIPSIGAAAGLVVNLFLFFQRAESFRGSIF